MRWPWRRRRDADSGPTFHIWARSGNDPAERRRTRRLEMVAVVAGVVGALAAVLALLPHGDQGSPADAALTDGPSLSLEEVVVRNGPAEYTTAGDAAKLPGGRQTLASSPTIDLTVLNRGTRLALVTGIRVRILDSAALPVCYTQGGGPVAVSARYTIRLPSDPLRAERLIHRPLHQQIPADDVDRFVFRFAPLDMDQDKDQLFAIHLELTISGGKSIDVGRFVIGMPGAPAAVSTTFPVGADLSSQAWGDGPLALAPTWCFRHNLEATKRLLGAAGRRSPELSAIGPVTPASSWVRNRDATPPRAAALALVAPRNGADEMVLAAYAASKTGDAAFVKQIRAEAARHLLDMAKSALDDGWRGGAISNVRASLALEETPEARTVLAQALARKR